MYLPAKTHKIDGQGNTGKIPMKLGLQRRVRTITDQRRIAALTRADEPRELSTLPNLHFRQLEAGMDKGRTKVLKVVLETI